MDKVAMMRNTWCSISLLFTTESLTNKAGDAVTRSAVVSSQESGSRTYVQSPARGVGIAVHQICVANDLVVGKLND